MSGRAVPSGPPARLLLADSDPALRRVLHLALEAHGYQVALADTATAALELAGHEHPDLIVLDRSLPGAAAAIRALRHAAATPILLLTWSTHAGLLIIADAGDRDVPLDTSDLLHLDEQGRTLAREHLLVINGLVRWRKPERGVIFDLVHRGHPVGCLIVIRRHTTPMTRLTRLALATVADTLAATDPTASRR
jgi:CheY-like chemotaxis protein